MQELEQKAATNRIDQHRAVLDRPPFKGHAVAMGADHKADHALAKGFKERIGVARIIAQISNNESIVVIKAIDLRQRAGTGVAKKTLGQFIEFANAEQPGLIRTVAANDCGSSSA